MNLNPRNAIALFGLSAALVLPMTACATQPTGTTPAPAPASTGVPDCDLGDLAEGDSDCDNPTAYAAAVKKYGAKKVAQAKAKHTKKVAEQRAREEKKRLEDEARKRINGGSNTSTGQRSSTSNSTSTGQSTTTKRKPITVTKRRG